MRLFRHPWWQHLDYRVKVATTQENKPPSQGTGQWTFTTPRWRCGSILLPSLIAGVPEPTGGIFVTWWRWIVNWIEVKHEYQHLHRREPRPGWRWDVNLWTRMEVRQYIQVVESDYWDLGEVKTWLAGGKTHIVKHIWVWDNAYMKYAFNLLDLNGSEMLPGCRWYVNIRTWIEVRLN